MSDNEMKGLDMLTNTDHCYAIQRKTINISNVYDSMSC